MNLTIVTGRRYPQDDLDRFLRSASKFAVVLADGIGDGPIDQPNVRQISLPGQSLAELRGAALAAAETEAVAFVDPDCRLDRRWPAAAHRAIADYPAVCGPVEYAGGRSIVSWAAFLAEYGAFVPPSSATAGVAGTNLIVRRTLLEQGGPFWKDEAVDRLGERGTPIHYVPEMLVHHRRPWRLLPFVADRLRQGRCYAGRRTKGRVERLGRAAAAPLSAVVLFGRLARSFWPKRRRRVAFVVAAPLVFIFFLAWAVGEAIGYLHGPGDSCRYC